MTRSFLIAALCVVLAACGGSDTPPEPPSLEVVGRLSVPGGRVHGLALSGPLVHVAAGFDGLLVVDVADLSLPRIVGGVPPKEPFATASDNVVAVAVDGRLAVLAVAPGCVGTCQLSLELRVFDLSIPTSPKLLSTLPEGTRSIALSGQRLYAVRDAFGFDANGSSSFGRLDVIDLADPARPRLLGAVAVAANGAIALQGQRLAIAFSGCAPAGSGAQVVDITDPLAPRVVASQGCGISVSGASTAALGDASLYVVHGDPSLDIHRLAGPGFEATRWSLANAAQGVDRLGTTLYVTQQAQGVAVFDLSLPLPPNPPQAVLTPSQSVATRSPALAVRVADGVGVAVTDAAAADALVPRQGLEFFRPK
ncbi:LVIVD repeat-containing protein [Ideonella sp. A 288]|uniref:LVIVD repeat-containing protein n=1 Tax=Ideonella sp. A 288 TaxID=1962181 RepID=UPI001303186E|nr:hypothetical protein [Ideonella sp. A 288]